MNMTFPFQIDNRGHAKTPTRPEYIRQLIEQVLFTVPGERVNQPEFGTDLMKMVFLPNSDELASTNQFLVQGALQRWLGDLIQIEAVQVNAEENSLQVSVEYSLLQTQEQRTESFQRSI